MIIKESPDDLARYAKQVLSIVSPFVGKEPARWLDKSNPAIPYSKAFHYLENALVDGGYMKSEERNWPI